MTRKPFTYDIKYPIKAAMSQFKLHVSNYICLPSLVDI